MPATNPQLGELARKIEGPNGAASARRVGFPHVDSVDSNGSRDGR